MQRLPSSSDFAICMARTPRQLALAYDELDTPADLSPTELLV